MLTKGAIRAFFSFPAKESVMKVPTRASVYSRRGRPRGRGGGGSRQCQLQRQKLQLVRKEDQLCLQAKHFVRYHSKCDCHAITKDRRWQVMWYHLGSLPSTKCARNYVSIKVSKN